MSILQELAAFTAAMSEQGINVSVDLTPEENLQRSIDNARACGVNEEDIIHDENDLNALLGW